MKVMIIYILSRILPRLRGTHIEKRNTYHVIIALGVKPLIRGQLLDCVIICAINIVSRMYLHIEALLSVVCIE